MEEIALAILPSGVDSDEESADNSASDATSTNDDEIPRMQREEYPEDPNDTEYPGSPKTPNHDPVTGKLGVPIDMQAASARGGEHSETLTSMTNLASTYRNQGRWKEAEELQAKELGICLRVLGDEHPSTLTSMANLASTYGNQGRWKEAEKLEVQVMETRKRVLGEEHPFTLAPPNFELGADKAPANPPNAIRMKNGVIDKEAQRLKKVEGFWENKLLDRQKKKPGPNASQEIKDKYKTAEATLKSLYDVALKKRLLYGKERVLKDNPKDQSLIAEIDELREQLKALEAGDKKEDGKKEDNTLVHPSSPDITVSEPNGKTRAPTGLDAVPSKDGIRNRK